MASTKVELAIADVVNNFYIYTKLHKRDEKLNRKEFGKMVKQELSHVLTNTEIKEAVDKLMADLDADGDKKISFCEYWSLITTIAKLQSQQRSRE